MTLLFLIFSSLCHEMAQEWPVVRGTGTNITAGAATSADHMHASMPCLHSPHPRNPREISHFAQGHVHRISLSSL